MTKIDLPPEKKVGHLTLLREPRSITAKEFNALSPSERLDIVRRARGRQKYELLLEASDVRRLVRRLPSQELFMLIKELGPENVPELMELVTTEQFTTFLDLDCWRDQLLEGSAALQWLQVLAEGEEDRVFATLREIDQELLVLLLKKFLSVTRSPADVDDDEARSGAAGGYEVEYLDAEGGKIVNYLLELLFRRDEAFAAQLLEAVRWEQESLLEEEVYRLRTGRLQDRGFPDPFEALGVYAFIDPAGFDPAGYRKSGVLPGEEGVEAPGFALAAARPRNLLAEILAGGVSSGFCWELTYLLNKVMVADRTDVGDVQQVQEQTDEVYRYVNLALEHLSGGDLQKATGLLEEIYLEVLFRLGFSLTLELQRRATPLAKGALAPYLDGPFRALLDGLSRRKPRFFEGLEQEDRGGERPFSSLSELRLSGEWLGRLEVQAALFQEHFPFQLSAPAELRLEGCFPDDPEDLALSDFFLTALANRVLGRPFLPEPIPQAQLPELHARICAEGQLHQALRSETVHWLESLAPGAGAFGDYCLGLWEQEFCAQPVEDLDPRYLSGLIVRMD
ncbi:hypothetical protein DESUT3_29400 [Desulfuromonas versatilis]|uniref:Uncharacterized protein n=1 Tax=Desulfuromonas versatilis TaxID=2802975 RepID=A0ABN6E0Q2_9BACT|nr:DUF6178 family protein [Desulfuromonas versatilis]BCR05871.1 hypothetical protein DESUT3_29400 [Desulfuromonas versatilis]